MSCVYADHREGEAELVLEGVDIKGGNISLMLDEAGEKEYLDTGKIPRTIPTGFSGAAPTVENAPPRFLPGCRVNTITDGMMHQLEARFGVKGPEGCLS